MNWLPAQPSPRLAALVLLGSSALWGLSWWPLKALTATGLSGPQVSLLAYGLVGVLGLGLLWRDRLAWRGQWRWVLGLMLVGGWANASFVNALMLGDVVRVMFLFYLSPVWSVLGGRLFLGERVPPLRWLAVGVALCGLWLVLGAQQGPDAPAAGAMSLGLSLIDALALSAGLAFAGNHILARAAREVPLRTKTFSVFVGCGLMSALATLALGHGWPQPSAAAWLGVLAYGFGGLLLATVTWQYGVTHLEAGRAGVIVLGELVTAVVTAVWWGDGHLSALGWMGGALIAMAAVMEALTGPQDATAETSSERHAGPHAEALAEPAQKGAST